ncbi:MAG: hypothetical protein F4Y28_07205 [Acidimicrobiia bacterium]|nr:hypothetical protein [Acidimicrobiia bacterium]MYG58034.1 hypothetical protein [Acidimicrobiia bacterium]MYJ32523.1 hypothetical protein [Acidimicrobiia bacterium]
MNQLGKPHGAIGVSGRHGIISPAYFVAEISEEADPRYVHHLLRTRLYISEYERRGKYMPPSQFDISWEQFRDISVTLPPLSEQRAIANFLDIECDRLDALISKKRRLIKLLDERRAAYVGAAVVAGLGNRNDLVETGNHHVPRLPTGWRLMRLRHVVEQIIDTPHKTAPVVDEEDYLVVRTSNVKMGRLIFDDARYTDKASWIEWNRRGEPRPGDVMFTREAPAGEACVVPVGVRLCIGQRMVLFRVNPAVACGEWIVHSIYSGPAQRFIEELSNATTVAHLNMSDIHDVPIAVPNLDEQQRILAQIRVEVRRHEQMVPMLDKQIALLAERRQALVTAVVTGEMPVPGMAA